jgi:hypothetical protein
MGNLQPLTSPDTLDPLVVDCPACLAQELGDLAIAIAAVLPGKLDKLEQLEARMDEIVDRVARDRTNAARERTSHP